MSGGQIDNAAVCTLAHRMATHYRHLDPAHSNATTYLFRGHHLLAFVNAVRANDALVPIDMVLHCPDCGEQHIDAPETDEQYTARLHESSWWELGGGKPARWMNDPHRSHLCHSCGWVWRPADVFTNGVAAVMTRGQKDSPISPEAGRVRNDAVVAEPRRLPITAGMVRALRDKSDQPMMVCKRALVQARGDMAAAEELLRARLVT
jgi:hypothetical protein